LDQREELLHQPLDEIEKRVPLWERHLDIDLRKLRLAVGAEIFVAKTPDNLEVAVKAPDHQNLLEELRRLRQGVKLAVMQAAGDQVIARAFRRRARHERRLDLAESMLGEVPAN